MLYLTAAISSAEMTLWKYAWQLAASRQVPRHQSAAPLATDITLCHTS